MNKQMNEPTPNVLQELLADESAEDTLGPSKSPHDVVMRTSEVVSTDWSFSFSFYSVWNGGVEALQIELMCSKRRRPRSVIKSTYSSKHAQMWKPRGT